MNVVWLSLFAYAAWFIGAVLAVMTRRARRRFVVSHLIGLIVGLVVTTTATPPTTAVPLGVAIGASLCCAVWLFIRRGVTFTWTQGETHWEDDRKAPLPEKLAMSLTAISALVCILAMSVNMR